MRVMAGALLHDITKTKSIQTRENHALTGQELLENLGYARIGKIVGCHVLMPMSIFFPRSGKCRGGRSLRR